jgi:hypothetical protein
VGFTPPAGYLYVVVFYCGSGLCYPDGYLIPVNVLFSCMRDCGITSMFLPLIIIDGAVYGIYRWKKGKKPTAVPAESKETK